MDERGNPERHAVYDVSESLYAAPPVFGKYGHNRAEGGDVNGGKAMIQRSMLLRTAAMFIIFFALAKSGICNVIALVVPLLFVRPTITIAEFFRKKGDA